MLPAKSPRARGARAQHLLGGQHRAAAGKGRSLSAWPMGHTLRRAVADFLSRSRTELAKSEVGLQISARPISLDVEGQIQHLDLLTTTEASSSAGRRKQPPRAAKTPREREPRRKRAAVLPNRHGALAHTCRFGSTGGSLVCGDAGVCAPRGERSCPSEYSLISLSLVWSISNLGDACTPQPCYRRRRRRHRHRLPPAVTARGQSVLRENVPFLSAFPMFVPSLSW